MCISSRSVRFASRASCPPILLVAETSEAILMQVHQRSDPQAFKPGTARSGDQNGLPGICNDLSAGCPSRKIWFGSNLGDRLPPRTGISGEGLLQTAASREGPNHRKCAVSSCIRDYIEYERLKIVASRAAWLGNDQAHYTQKHTDRDLEDLKKLIQLTMHWITLNSEWKKRRRLIGGEEI